GIVLIVLAIVRSACAASVHVTYLVECPDFLQAGSRLERPVTLELYPTHTCKGSALVQQDVTVEAVPAPHANGRQSALALETEIVSETSSPELYVRLIG